MAWPRMTRLMWNWVRGNAGRKCFFWFLSKLAKPKIKCMYLMFMLFGTSQTAQTSVRRWRKYARRCFRPTDKHVTNKAWATSTRGLIVFPASWCPGWFEVWRKPQDKSNYKRVTRKKMTSHVKKIAVDVVCLAAAISICYCLVELAVSN